MVELYQAERDLGLKIGISHRLEALRRDCDFLASRCRYDPRCCSHMAGALGPFSLYSNPRESLPDLRLSPFVERSAFGSCSHVSIVH